MCSIVVCSMVLRHFLEDVGVGFGIIKLQDLESIVSQ